MSLPVRIALALGPDGVLTALAVLGFAAVAVHLRGTLAVPTDTVTPYLLVGAILLGTTALVRSPLLLGRRDGDRRRFVATQARALRVWAPFVILYLCYRALRGVLLLIPASRDQHALLKRADEAIFGVSPAWWLQQFATPWLTELMAVAYALMFVLPMVVLVTLYARGHDRVLRRCALAILIAFHLGFVVFLLVPARSPDIVYDFGLPLHGHGFYEWSSASWARLQQITFDAFPSMHTTISTIALSHAYRHGPLLWPRHPRRLFAIFVPAVLLLQLSTLYLRQHYFVDLGPANEQVDRSRGRSIPAGCVAGSGPRVTSVEDAPLRSSPSPCPPGASTAIIDRLVHSRALTGGLEAGGREPHARRARDASVGSPGAGAERVATTFHTSILRVNWPTSDLCRSRSPPCSRCSSPR